MAEDVRAKLASVTVVYAKDLFPAGDRLDEQVVDWARHGFLVTSIVRKQIVS
jgi:hypothetical protein